MSDFAPRLRTKCTPNRARPTNVKSMRYLAVTLALAFMLGGCTSEDQARSRQKARESGRELQRDLKQAGDKAQRGLDEAGREIDKGLGDASDKAGRAVDHARREIDKNSSEADRQKR